MENPGGTHGRPFERPMEAFDVRGEAEFLKLIKRGGQYLTRRKRGSTAQPPPQLFFNEIAGFETSSRPGRTSCKIRRPLPPQSHESMLSSPLQRTNKNPCVVDIYIYITI